MILVSMYKKIIILFVLVGLLAQSLAFPSVAMANTAPWYMPDYQGFMDKVNGPPDGEIFGERYTHAQVWWIIYSLISFALERNVSQCATDNPDSLDSFIDCVTVADASSPNMASLGFLEFARLSDEMVRVKPASGVSYVASVLDHIGISTASAQEGGFGFNTLSPVLGLWRASRNASYALMTLAVVLLALMIMFRMKISPQASVTVMSAIPRIVIGLILVTFSFGIAGFVIDMAYVVLGIVAAVVSQSGIASNDSVAIFNLVNDIRGGILNFGLAVVWMVFRGGFASVFTVYIGFVASLLVLVIALILIIVAVVRIFWIFLRTYVMVILHVVALPFAALAYVASPSGNMFLQLLRSLIGHVSVFVTVSLTVMVAHILLFTMSAGGGILSNVTVGNIYEVQPVTGSSLINLPGFTGVDPTMLGLFVGIVVMLMAPSIANNIKSLIISGRMAREGFSMIGAGTAAAAGGMAGVGARVGAQDYVSQVDRRLAAAGGATTTRLRGEQAFATGLRSVFRLK